MKKNKFYKQLHLLLEVLPYVSSEKRFALKGGTAINLFVRNFPRLSVDIDLTYLGEEPRPEALRLTEKALYGIKENLETRIKGISILPSSRNGLENDTKLFIKKNDVQIKIEANPVIRGALFPVTTMSLAPKVVDEFELEIDIQVLSLADLYGGKIAAALDRQHPRDLFDIKILNENEGITDTIKDGFIIYLLCHKRPPNEILRPTKKNMKTAFDNEFLGMSPIDFTYGEFEKVRDNLISNINSLLSTNDRKFLLSFYHGEPDWSLFSKSNAEELPAIKWKLQNIEKMSQEKKNRQVEDLEKLF